MTSEEKKIIIDEDWKSQVEREREELKAKEDVTGVDSEPSPESGSPADAGQIPAASFPLLVTTLATQALAAMGQLADPATGQPLEAHPELAKHHIDTLGMLQEKTKGNLDTEEANMLEDTVHQLRMLFVTVSNQSSA